MKTFEEVFTATPSITSEAPGRVNLLGEHTDYNDGFVLPTAIPQKTHIAMRESAGETFTVYAASLDKIARFTLATPPTEHFASYIFGCIREIEKLGVRVPALDIYVYSDVPIGVGLSSSAALEVATLRALRALFEIPLDDQQIAQLAQKAEIEYAGVNCGIMDQMASSLANTNSMLFLDTRSLERKLLPLPLDAEILVVNSGITRTLANSKYNERRTECEVGARLLGLRTLRDIADMAGVKDLPELLRRRVQHVVTENHRVLQALNGIDASEFGTLMNASHQSLRDDYEVSVPPLDYLVQLLQDQSAVYGARLTGAGFGGACVALCRAGEAKNVGRKVVEQYNQTQHKGSVLVPKMSD
ncbi:MAG: galactokinase [Pseudomonadota bacterium]